MRGSYIIPELHNYVWLLDRDPGGTDLLVIRVDREGNVLKPLVVFDSDRWDHPQFRSLLRHEWSRRDSDVEIKFILDPYEEHYMHGLTFNYLTFFTRPRIQFCAILPLDRGRYKRQRAKMNEQDNIFSSFERLLDIPSLLADADHA